MSGRGRNATLPSWMTNGSVTASESSVEAIETGSKNESVDISLTSSSNNNKTIIAPITTIQNVTTTMPSYSIPTFHNPTTATAIIPTTIIPQQSFVPKPTSFATNVFPQPIPAYSGLGRGVNIIPSSSGVPGSIPPGYSAPPWNPMTTQFGHPTQLPYQMPVMPNAFVPPPRAFPPPGSYPGSLATPTQPFRPTSTGPPQLAMDPNNDVKAWSEHTGTDGRIYWFNKITAASTYEKPFCLKTPEERAIPPCPWKEYVTPEGKKYYGNGTDSVYVLIM